MKGDYLYDDPADSDHTVWSSIKPPPPGSLRYVKRLQLIKNTTIQQTVKVLQAWRWSLGQGRWGWFDIPMMEEETSSIHRRGVRADAG